MQLFPVVPSAAKAACLDALSGAAEAAPLQRIIFETRSSAKTSNQQSAISKTFHQSTQKIP
jgi:hypothetical protein